MTSTPDYTSFPRNEMGEPLMDGAAWRFEQALDAESDYYDEFAAEIDPADYDDPDWCSRCDYSPCACHKIDWGTDDL